MREDILNKKNEILKWIDEKYSKTEICRELNCRPQTLNTYLEKMDIIYIGNKGGKGRKVGIKKGVENYLYNGCISINSHKLKNKLIEENIKEHKCEKCGRYEWEGEKIPIELHHIDGVRFNNELTNLQILCPNCHTFTDNYSGKKNKKNEDINRKTNKCECGEDIHKKSLMCSVCHKKTTRKVKRPPYTQLLKEIQETSYCSVGRKYNVSDNTIRKWIKNYEN